MVDAPIELSEFYTFRGSEVRYVRLGEGPPVVLCHGTPWSSYVWRSLARVLSDRFSVYLWDMLGYGQSDKRDTDVSLRAQGELLSQLLGLWQLDQPHVVAHDYGGAVALRAHLLHGHDFASLVLADVVALRPWGSPFFRLVKEHPDVFAALPENLHEALVREYISGASHVRLPESVLDHLTAPWLGAGQAAFYRQIAHADEAYTDEIEPLYDTMKLPTLVIWGHDDSWIPASQAERLASVIPGATLEMVPNAGHLLQEDAPDDFNKLVTGWLHELS